MKKEEFKPYISDEHVQTEFTPTSIIIGILLSNIEFFLSIIRRTPIEITAAGIEAEIVKPTLRPK